MNVDPRYLALGPDMGLWLECVWFIKSSNPNYQKICIIALIDNW